MAEQKKTINLTVPILVVLLMIASGVIGAMWMKMKKTENTTIPAANAPAKTASFTDLAKKINLDVKKFESCLSTDKYAQAVKDDLALGQEVGVNGTPSFFIDGYPLVGAQPFATFKLAIDARLAGKPINLPLPSGEPAPVLLKADQIAKIMAKPAGSKGPADAKVTIVEFSDFQCPYCANYSTQTYTQISQNYGDKIRYLFHNYPLPFHNNAQKAAEAAECAGEQGKFWEMHDLLFQNQSAWSGTQ
jgi:protein-disulfide isomerase